MSPERKRIRLDPERYLREGGGSLVAALEKHDPFWGPQLVVAGAIVLDLSLPDKLTSSPALAALVTIGPVVARAVNILG